MLVRILVGAKDTSNLFAVYEAVYVTMAAFSHKMRLLRTLHEFRMVDKDELDWGRTTQNRKRTTQAEYFIRRPRANTCLILDENKDENFFEVLTSNTTNYF